ncbi:hypothetical protein PGN35_001585 [Nodosilinea sp. PGN35]|uniref:hypothetical protein n=1 Tax=Nodosilinea sp. PGN35 TaxID=3020489 RepID=UPI0023B228F4|nr:hypothetical protein [Nodosilinea sp. TSF1-S3]MDF0368901.1 hypothetical protein [Nodosilinea sp. TSF1-S3]
MHIPFVHRLLPHWMSCGLAAIASGSLTLGTAIAAQAEQTVVFAIENNTSTPLLEFYATPTEADDWGENRLDSTDLPPASALQIRLDNPPENCLYDVLGIFGDGDDDYVEEYGVDLCTLHGGTYAFFDANDHVFQVNNQTAVPIIGFYFTPASSEDWGINLFKQSGYALQPGESVDLPVNSSECAYDFRAVFADGDIDEESVNVCDGAPAITFEED